MNRLLARWIEAAVLGGTILAAGGYFVYYLYNWQWVRAQTAGIFFVAALVIAGTRLVIARIDRLRRDVSRRLDDVVAASLERPSGIPSARITLDGSVDGSTPDFPWLGSDFAPPRAGRR